MEGIGLFSLHIVSSLVYQHIILLQFSSVSNLNPIISNNDSSNNNNSKSSCNNNINNVEENNSTLSNIMKQLERRVQQDEGNRGIQNLCIDGELQRIVESLYDPKIRHITILTGFPCMIDYVPPTETDGPLGALAIARALLELPHNKSIKIVTDECNEEVMLMAVAASGLFERYNNHRGCQSSGEIKNPTTTYDQINADSFDYNYDSYNNNQRLSLQSFPNQFEFNVSDAEELKKVSDWTDAVIAIERPGPNSSGEYLTMSKRRMCHLVAPLEDIIGYKLHIPGNIIDELLAVNNSNNSQHGHDLSTVNDVILNPPHTAEFAEFLSIGIGDGGNEVGMGKVYHKLIDTAHCNIPHSQDIACIVPTTYLLVTSVSNWGGYSLAMALALFHFHHQNSHQNCKLKNTQLQSNEMYSLPNQKLDKWTTVESTINYFTNITSKQTHVKALQSTDKDRSVSVQLFNDIMSSFLSTEVLETEICCKMIEYGARDGMTGKQEVSVDGISWLTHMETFYELKQITSRIV